MFRTAILFVGFVMLLGAGVAVAAWPRGPVSASGFSNDEVLARAFVRIREGMPVSKLSAIGLDTAKARRLSALALMEAFMPKNSTDVDAIDPALQACFTDPQGCTGFMFEAVAAEALVVTQHGRVSYKLMLGLPVAKLLRAKKLARLED